MDHPVLRVKVLYIGARIALWRTNAEAMTGAVLV